ncbi:Uu.00g063850.m01.CDS01 [Anthostomella pinea]|uniref:Uu.00g063850.m01.CDS01 n=1 Tax=Anthostomella pinea TaxID=933095 RepID=A0AAI8YN28_9PEZI|nr:Uu.00g063850.m01.CDS01 [Anthostomella pinea]
MCSFVPLHLLQALSESPSIPLVDRHGAQNTLSHDVRLANSIQSQPTANVLTGAPLTQQELKTEFVTSLNVNEQADFKVVNGDASHPMLALSALTVNDVSESKLGHLWREIYDANHVDSPDLLPGILLRAEGEPSSAQPKSAVLNAAYDNFEKTFTFFHKVFGRNSLNDRGMPLVANIHYSTNYANAFWLPSQRQMIFGDGGAILTNLTSLDVIAHELVHGLTQFTACLEYQGQSGALNEHISDAFASMVKQWDRGQQSADADWMIGDSCLCPGVEGLALRSLKFPGTAYDKLAVSRDPQPGSMAAYVDTSSDFGGVHINSGVPNRAFYLVCLRLGGCSWERAGRIWYDTLLSPDIKPNCTFIQFADLTCQSAGKLFGPEVQGIVKGAWMEVGVYPTLAFASHFDGIVASLGYGAESTSAQVFAFDGTSSGRLDHVMILHSGQAFAVATARLASDSLSAVSAQLLLGAEDMSSNAAWRGFAFDYKQNKTCDHIFLFAPGLGMVCILAPEAPGAGDGSGWRAVYSSKKGIGEHDFFSTEDRVLAFDLQHTGRLDHLVVYRPGSGLLSVLRNDNGVFASVFRTRTGLPGFDLSSVSDRLVAFDYEHIGRVDHILAYRPGSGLVTIFQNQDGVWKPVFRSIQLGTPGPAGDGIGGYPLSQRGDRILAFDLKGNGRKEYLAVYRPGAGIFWVIEGKGGRFTKVFGEGNPGQGKGAGVGGFDLSQMTDWMVAYNHPQRGLPDSLVCYRPADGRFVAVKPTWKVM